MNLLNIGSSARVAAGWTNVDFNWLARMATMPWLSWALCRVGVISKERWERIQKISRNIIVHDIRRPLPFAEATYDVVYHSHVLEHLDREAGKRLIEECRRVLKSGGVLRIVVPDLEVLVNRYTRALEQVQAGASRSGYDSAMSDLFDQMVNQVPSGRSSQNLVTRLLERIFVRDTRANGESHQWMYDSWSLAALLDDLGFADIKTVDATTSRIKSWGQWCLDVNEDGTIYKRDSIFIECQKPW